MKKYVWYLIISVVCASVWEHFGSRVTNVRLYVSSPSHIISYFQVHYSELLYATVTTSFEAGAGLVVAIIIGFGLMYICFYRPKLLDHLLPVMVGLQVIPIIVLAPLFLILLGIGVASKIALASVISFFPIFISFTQGYKAISVRIHEMLYINKAETSFRIRHTYFPLAMPSIMAGLKVSASLSVIGAIVAEFTGARVGVGKNLFVSAVRLNPDLMMSSLIMAALIGLTLYGLVSAIEKKFGSWYLSSN